MRRKRWYRFFLALTILTLLGFALGAGTLAGLFAAVTDVLPRGKALSDLKPAVPTRVLASDGTVLARIFSPDQNREVVPLSEMGAFIADATIAIEDIRFYEHPGIDLRGIARAMVKNIAAGNTKEGASTITQQLARGVYLSRRKELSRKLQEIVLALELERRYSKDEILEAYLNQVFYGSNPNSLQSWGAQMAAQNYFGKDANTLTLAEAALLAGLPKNPDGYDPYEHPKVAKQRRDQVLYNMLYHGMIGEKEYQAAINTPLTLIAPRPRPTTADAHAPYFVEYLRTVEMNKIYGRRDSYEMIYQHGVDIYTSLDPRMQKVAEDAVATAVERNKGRKIDDGALIALDPQTGLIKAMVGGTSFTKDQYNIVTQGRRQPGSSFKPFVYTTALLRGYTPATTVFDRHTSYPSGSGKPWAPRNSDGRYLGAMSLERALWLS
ncbi:MAG TPA: transglycosylase domain-containing protein, partial [Armatimonadota bacterium]|nr:transglycosylase domain-containing protein [Armatimonadota bacterium]